MQYILKCYNDTRCILRSFVTRTLGVLFTYLSQGCKIHSLRVYQMDTRYILYSFVSRTLGAFFTRLSQGCSVYSLLACHKKSRCILDSSITRTLDVFLLLVTRMQRCILYLFDTRMHGALFTRLSQGSSVYSFLVYHKDARCILYSYVTGHSVYSPLVYHKDARCILHPLVTWMQSAFFTRLSKGH